MLLNDKNARKGFEQGLEITETMRAIGKAYGSDAAGAAGYEARKALSADPRADIREALARGAEARLAQARLAKLRDASHQRLINAGTAEKQAAVEAARANAPELREPRARLAKDEFRVEESPAALAVVNAVIDMAKDPTSYIGLGMGPIAGIGIREFDWAAKVCRRCKGPSAIGVLAKCPALINSQIRC